jgi:hypothetical protein
MPEFLPSDARQVKGDDPDKKGYPRPRGRGLGCEASNLTCVKRNLLFRGLIINPGWILLVKDEGNVIRVNLRVSRKEEGEDLG